MRALVETIQSMSRRDLIALAIEIGAALLLIAAAAGVSQIGAAFIGLAEASGL